MNTLQSDAFVFFGAMGDLAFKKIFPSLQAMVQRGNLKVPVIGVDRSAENVDDLKARARSSLEKSGKFDALLLKGSVACCAMCEAILPTWRRFKPCARCLMMLKGRRFTWRFRRRYFRPWWRNWPKPVVPKAPVSFWRSLLGMICHRRNN